MSNEMRVSPIFAIVMVIVFLATLVVCDELGDNRYHFVDKVKQTYQIWSK